MKLVATLLLMTALAGHAQAEAMPRPGAEDPRMRTVAYDPSDVTEVIAVPGRSTSIELAPDEKIRAHSLGDEKAWVFATTGNLAFVTPNPEALRPSNVQIIATRADGSTRLYQIDLVVGSAPAASMAGIRYVYPADLAAARAADAAKAAEKAEAQQVADKMAVDFFYGQRNWKFVARGSPAAEPSEASDNGRETVFRFPGNIRTPSIFTGRCGAEETIAPVIARDDLVVVQTTAPFFCLRLGAQVAELRNVGFDPVGFNPRTGTSSPDVIRTLRARAVR